MAHNITQVFSHNDQQTNCSTRVFYEGTIAKFTGTRRLFEMTAPLNSTAVTDVAIHSMHQKGYQRKLSVVHSKGGRCNFLGFLHCDYRRSPRWSSGDGPQHDCSRSGTFMISMNYNSCASLAIFFIVPVCSVLFWTQNFVQYRSVSCVCFLLPYVSLQSNWVWKPSKLGQSTSVLSEDFCLYSRYNNVNYGAWHVYKIFFVRSISYNP